MRRFKFSVAAILLFAGLVASPMVFAGASVLQPAKTNDTQTNQTDEQPQPTSPKPDTPVTPTTPSDDDPLMPDVQTTGTQNSDTSFLYVAMGDSVAAGAGLRPYTDPTAQDQTCDRSPLAYPHVIAQELNTTVANLACSGAKVDEGIYDDQERNNMEIPAQLDRAFADGTPDLVTMTIGANDARWTQFIRNCYLFDCVSDFNEARAKVYRADLRVELYYALYQIQQASGNNPPQVLLSGYYMPFSNLSCIPTDQVTEAEQTWLKQQRNELNQAIRSVIPYFSFAEFVPLDFSGHRLCSNDPWIQGIQGEAPFHPTANGQASIAQSYLTKIDN